MKFAKISNLLTYGFPFCQVFLSPTSAIAILNTDEWYVCPSEVDQPTRPLRQKSLWKTGIGSLVFVRYMTPFSGAPNLPCHLQLTEDIALPANRERVVPPHT